MLIDNLKTYNVTTTKQVAKNMAKCLYENVRVYGKGKYERDLKTNVWRLLFFEINDFVLLEDKNTYEIFEKISKMDGNGWAKMTKNERQAECRRLKYGE
jgi:Fe-S cluster biosynthesis and repair protein YggX